MLDCELKLANDCNAMLWLFTLAYFTLLYQRLPSKAVSWWRKNLGCTRLATQARLKLSALKM
eukprot:scaffold648_cov75-Skeletonema_dohrnii-CCMP3373.AAC.6